MELSRDTFLRGNWYSLSFFPRLWYLRYISEISPWAGYSCWWWMLALLPLAIWSKFVIIFNVYNLITTVSHNQEKIKSACQPNIYIYWRNFDGEVSKEEGNSFHPTRVSHSSRSSSISTGYTHQNLRRLMYPPNCDVCELALKATSQR